MPQPSEKQLVRVSATARAQFWQELETISVSLAHAARTDRIPGREEMQHVSARLLALSKGVAMLERAHSEASNVAPRPSADAYDPRYDPAVDRRGYYQFRSRN